MIGWGLILKIVLQVQICHVSGSSHVHAMVMRHRGRHHLHSGRLVLPEGQDKMLIRYLTLAIAFLLASLSTASAQAIERPSTCLAVAQALPQVIYASFTTAAMGDEVSITYAGHSTYVIETPAGVRIATDFAGYFGASPVPDVVTMNRAHTSHHTPYPDPAIKHVLRGWGDNGNPAKHSVLVEDVYIRNVTTDIRRFGYVEKDGNSIFIFEVAGLCIGHLGHLHHPLDNSHYAAIGRLDVLMVPIDGGLTMSLEHMTEITRRLSSSIVLPMHRNATPLSEFTRRIGNGFELDFRDSRTIKVSTRTLPRRPTVVILQGV